MKKYLSIFSLFLILTSCEERTEKPENSRGIPGPEKVEAITGTDDSESRAEELKNDGYQVFLHKEGDSTLLMQQYYMVLLKKGQNRNQDSTETAELQKQHMAHLNRMLSEGYAGLTGPFENDGELRGVVIFNTRTAEEADSLARLDPMVEAGRLEVEVLPWWTVKGRKLE